MIFESYTRTGMFLRLDADLGAECGFASNVPSSCMRSRIGLGWILALGGWVMLLSPFAATAQTAGADSTAGSAQPTKSSTQKPAVHHASHHYHHAKPQAATVAAAPIPTPPPLPPAEQPANPATVDFKDGRLSVRAQNSSLITILSQIQHQTGLVIDGLSHDQRIYGQYGPGSISATLSSLLDGSGYDFVIVGGESGHGAPRLILSVPGAASAGAAAPTPTPPAAANNEEQPQPDATEIPPPENVDGDAPQAEGDQGGPADPTAPPQAKSPQEIFNELRRQQPQ